VSYWYVGAVVGGAVIGAAGSQSAADTQAAGQMQAAQTQLAMFRTLAGQQQPFIQGGYGALNQLLYGLGEAPTSTPIGPGGSFVPNVGVNFAPGGVNLLPGGGTTSPTDTATPVPGQPAAGPSGVIGGPTYAGQVQTPGAASTFEARPGTQPGPAAPGAGPGWMPTPGGGVQQILTNGPATGAPSGTPGWAPRPGSNLAGTPTGGFVPSAVSPNAPQGPTISPGGGVGFGQFTSGFSPTDFLNNLDPGYGFQLATGAQAIRNQNTPTMGALSGPALKDLMSFNQNMAATGYQNAFNRFQTQNQAVFGRLSAIAGLGQNAAANVGAAGTSLGTGIAQAQAAAAGSQAGGIVGATNALGNAASALPLYSLLGANQPPPAAPAGPPTSAGDVPTSV
jgi:hypothetical protein